SCQPLRHSECGVMALSPSTIAHDGAGAASTAMGIRVRSSLAAINDNEPGARSVNAPLADYHFQFAGADAPRQRPVSLSLLPEGTGHHLPGRAFVAAPGLSFDVIRLPAGLVQHLPTHPVLKFLRGRWAFHFSKRLS